MPLKSLDEFPGYRVVGPISRGGQGVVLHAIQEGTQREVAIKLPADGPFESAAAASLPDAPRIRLHLKP